MLRHFILISWRNLLRTKFYTILLVLGLAIGISSALLLGMYTWHELTYDNFHERKERIFLVGVHSKDENEEGYSGWTPPPTGPALEEFFPEVEATVRICTWFSDVMVSQGDRKFAEDNIIGADSSIFDVFTIPFVAGDPKTALREPNSVVITEEIARKYFGNNEALGQTIHFDQFFNECKVTGIIAALPDNSHLDIDFLVSLTSWKSINFDFGHWTNHTFVTYALLNDGVAKEKIESQLPRFLQKNLDPYFIKRYQKTYNEIFSGGNIYEFFLVPLKDVHLSTLLFENREGKRLLTYALGIIGLIIVVLVACNYTNLATVLTFSRAKEVGIRKVTGSRSGALFRQFIVESILLVFMGLILAIGVVQVVLPYFNEVTRKELSLDYTDPRFILGLCVFVFVLGLLSGIYPALRFSSFNPVSALKGQVAVKGHRMWLRNFLVIFQFTICIIMIVSTLVVYKQLSFMTNKSVGFEKEQILIIKRPDGLGKNKMTFKNELIQNAAVTAVSITQTIPGRNFDGHGQHFQGRPADEWFTIYPLVADPDIFEILDLQIVSGQPLSDSLGTQAVLNESAVQMLKTTNPFDLTIDKGTLGNVEVDVVGVVKDFHFKSFYFPIEPLVIFPLDVENDPQHRATFILAKINNRNVATTVSDIEKTWKKFAPSYPFEYTFLDEDFNRLFERERTMTKVYTVFSVISVCIACLGLLGLSSYFANKRTKEIGIRKIVGASFLNIAEILSLDFLKWIIVAIVLGSLISWFLMQQWLQNFAYKTELSMWIFLVAAICVVFISILTVSWHLFKAANRNPVETLRYE